MNTLQKHCSHLIAVLAVVALAACVKSDQANQTADSPARNLTLAPTESTAAMRDVPAPATEPAKPAPEKKTPQPKPKPPVPKPVVPTTLTAAVGTRVPLAASESISTRQAKAGDSFTATVMQGRGVTKADAAKVGGGAVAGALVGKLLGKNTKGALIGGAVGAAAGAAAARASRDIDIVLPKGAAITLKLNKPLTVKRAA